MSILGTPAVKELEVWRETEARMRAAYMNYSETPVEERKARREAWACFLARADEEEAAARELQKAVHQAKFQRRIFHP
jgi:hypothetical protein